METKDGFEERFDREFNSWEDALGFKHKYDGDSFRVMPKPSEMKDFIRAEKKLSVDRAVDYIKFHMELACYEFTFDEVLAEARSLDNS